MTYVEVTFENGNTIRTGINATLDEARRYYIGQAFELDEERPMVKAVKVEELVDEPKRLG